MLRTLSLLLVLWAIVATGVAVWSLTSSVPSTPYWHTGPVAPDEHATAAAAELSRLRRRVAELEAARPGAIGDSVPAAPRTGDPEEIRPGASPSGRVAELVAEYRRCREAGAIEDREIAGEDLMMLAERNDNATVAWAGLVGEAREEEELDVLLVGMQQLAAGADAAAAIRETARSLLAAAEPWRRKAGASLLLGVGRAGVEDVRTGLDSLRRESASDVRRVLVGDVAQAAWGLELGADERREILTALRRELRDGGSDLANSLAFWSTDRADLDLVHSLVARETDPSALAGLLAAYRAGVPLTKGREDECRRALLGVSSDPGRDVRPRRRALQLLESHRPWDDVTTTAIGAATADVLRLEAEATERR